MAGWWPALVVFLLLFGVWELTARIKDAPIVYLPEPSTILAEVFGRLGFYSGHAAVTLREAGLGFLIGASIATVAAVFMADSSIMDRGLLPFFVVVKVTPSVPSCFTRRCRGRKEPSVCDKWFAHGGSTSSRRTSRRRR